MGPSRVTATSSTLIDHIVSSSQVPVLRSVQTCGLSDHKVQIVNLDYSVNKVSPKVQYVRSFQKCQWDELKSVLRSVPWDTMYSFDNIDDQWAFFHTFWKSVLITSSHYGRFILRNPKGPHHGSQRISLILLR